MPKAIQAYRDYLKSFGHSDVQVDAIVSSPVTAHRNPTASELSFGYGATHYADFDRELWIKPDGTMKKYIVSPYDGLRYYR